MSEWISVKDRLPEDDNPILIYIKNAYGCGEISICNEGKSFLTGKYVPFAMFSGNQFFSMTNRKNEHLSNITHWMPLPEPPK